MTAALPPTEAPPSPGVIEPPNGSPLPPLTTVYGADYPAPEAPDGAKVPYLTKLIEQTNPMAHTLARQAAKHALYANGRMWIDWDNRKREFRDQPLDEHEIRVSMNHIRPMLRARTARLLSGPVDWLVVPSSNGLEARDQAKVGVNFLRGRYRHQRLAETLDAGLEYAYYGGVAALKSFWNPSIGPKEEATLAMPVEGVDPETGAPTVTYEARPIVVEAGTGAVRFAEDGEQPARYPTGDTDTALRTVYQIRLNPEATGWRQADGLRWLIDLEEVPLSVAKARFPEFAAKISAAQQGSIPNATTERVAASAVIRDPAQDWARGVASTKATNQEPTVRIVEYWEVPGPYFRGGRMIQAVGEVVTYDDAFPDGVFPYDPVYDEPSPGWWPGRPCVADMVDPSDVINRQWTSIGQEMWEQGIGQFVAFDVPGVPNQLGREPRQVLKIPLRQMVAGKGIRDLFARIDAAQVPPDRWRMIEAAQRVLWDIGSYHEVTRGQTPPGVDSGVAIERLVEQEEGQLKKATEALRQTLLSWGRKQLTIARHRYKGAKRWIPAERPDMGYLAESVSGVDLPDPETVVIELEHFRPRSQAAFQAQITDLMEKGLIPPAEGLRLLDLGRGVEGAFASQTRQYAKARQENLWLEREWAEYRQVGEQPIVDPVTGMPLADPVSGEPTGETEPVSKCVVPDGILDSEGADRTPPEPGAPEPADPMAPPADPNAEPEMDPDAPFGRDEGGRAWIPLLLNTEDDHLLHIEVHQEIALDVSKPWRQRQLALAHIGEHRDVMALMAPPALPPAA